MNWETMYSHFVQSVANLRKRKSITYALSIAGLLSVALQSTDLNANYSDEEFSVVITPAEKQLDGIRNQEIKQIKMVLSRNDNKAKRVDLLLRLGQVYTEKFKFYFFKENEIWNKKIDAYIALDDKQRKGKRRPRIDAGESKKFVQMAINELEKALKSVRNYNKLDELYYYLAFNYWELGKRRRAARYFTMIARKYPKSPYASESYRHLADDAFERQKFKSARVYFKKAAKDTKTPTYPRVLYGLAWSEFKNGRSRTALNTMLTAIKRSKVGSELEARRHGIALQNDAYDAIVLFYSEAGKPERAGEFFEKELGKQVVPELLTKLLKTYQRQGRYGLAVKVSEQMRKMDIVSEAESDHNRFEILLSAFKLAQQKQQRSKEMKFIKQLVSEFGHSKSDEVRIKVKDLVANSARVSHKISMKSYKKHRKQKHALELYNLYLATWATDMSTSAYYQTRFYMADLYFAIGKYRQAANEYRLLVTAATEDPDNSTIKKLKHGSIKGLIYSLDFYFKKRKRKRKAGRSELDELLSAIDAFVAVYPSDKETPKFLARAAGLLKDNKERKQEFEERLQSMIVQYPHTNQALESAVILVKEAEKAQEWGKLQSLIRGFLKNKALSTQDRKGKFKKELIAIRDGAKFKVVRGIEKEKNFEEAAERYEKLAKETRDGEVRFKSLNNAAVSWAKAGEFEDELRVLKKVARRYPERSDASQRILDLVNESFFQGEYETAAKKYEEFYTLHESRIHTRSKRIQNLAINALETAAFLRNALEQDKKAAENIRKIINASSRKIRIARTAAEEIVYDFASRYRRQGRKGRAINVYKRYLRAFPHGRYAIESALFIGVLYMDLREAEKAQSYFSDAQKIYGRKKGRSIARSELSYAAQARLLLLSGLEETYYDAKVSLPESQLKRDVQSKLKRMERLNKGYLQVIEYGDGKWALEALYKMSLAYQEFANALGRIPAPDSYSDKDKAKFRAQLRQIAKPVRTKVVETLKSALKKGELLRIGGNAMMKIAIAYALFLPEQQRLPLAYKVDWSQPKNWIMGKTEDVDEARSMLLKNPKHLRSLVQLGNYHLMREEARFAQMFYTRAFKIDKNHVPALNNLAYLEGMGGDFRAAMAGFRDALKAREFELIPKRNLSRLYMGSGLWEYAAQSYQQLEVRMPQDKEVVQGLGLSHLALGEKNRARTKLKGNLPDGENGKFARAMLELAAGDQEDALDELRDIDGENEFALMITDFWRKK